MDLLTLGGNQGEPNPQDREDGDRDNGRTSRHGGRLLPSGGKLRHGGYSRNASQPEEEPEENNLTSDRVENVGIRAILGI
jgi:hypothetical protein